MGTWGSGILQNDSAADSVVDAAGRIDEVVGGLASRVDPPSTAEAERMLGAVALLMRFSPYSLAAENDDRASVVAAITRLHLALPDVSAEANAALDAIVAGAEPAYCLTSFPPRLARILHGPNDDRVARLAMRDTDGEPAHVSLVVDVALALTRDVSHALSEIEAIYASLDYPECLRPFVRYEPAEESVPATVEEAERRLVVEAARFVNQEAARLGARAPR